MKKLFTVLFAAVVLCAALCSCGGSDKKSMHSDPKATPEVLTVEEVITDMKIGWNLGNTLDAPNGETSWGQPETTKAMIDTVCELGFGTIRIPVSWGRHVSGDDHKIDKKWMDRVQEVVDWALDNDMYVILNSHHDNEYYYPSKDKSEESVKYINDIWTQIAERFKDYDQHLIFESMNEPRLSGTPNEWSFNSNVQDCLDAAEVINLCNQEYVDVVRASGGRNTDRFLMVAPYAAAPYSALADEFVLPKDPSDKLLLSVHAYTPFDICMDNDLSKRTFTDQSKAAINDFMDKLSDKFIANGTRVIIGECGIINKGNPEDRYLWGEYFVSKAKEYGMMCVVWDNAAVELGSENYGILDRRNLKVFIESEEYFNGLMSGLK